MSTKNTNILDGGFKHEGFNRPDSNFFRLPNEWIDLTAQIKSLAEIKVVEYILRHTWGYQEYGIVKLITTDEFMHGRKRDDGSRMDSGTGLSNKSVIEGLKSAIKHGLLIEEKDDSDKARIKKFYKLNMKDEVYPSEEKLPGTTRADVKNLHIGVKNLHNSYEESTHRSEKDTLERNLINVNENFNRTDDKKRYGMQGLKDIMKQIDTVERKPASIQEKRKPRIATRQKTEEKTKRDYYAEQIATELQDQKSLGCYRVIAEKVPEGVIFQTLASIKETWKEGKIKQSRGALFVDIMKNYAQSKGIELGFA